jgi:hypothetical protein
MSRFYVTQEDKYSKCWRLQKKTTLAVMKYLRHRNHVLRIVTGFLPLPVGSFSGQQGAGTSGIQTTQCQYEHFKLMLVKDITKIPRFVFFEENLCRFMLFLMFYCILSAQMFSAYSFLTLFLKLLTGGVRWVIFCAPVCPICLEMFSTCSLLQSSRVHCCCVLFTSCSYCIVL